MTDVHDPSRPAIGVVGLGAVGGQIARLLSHGDWVYGANRSKTKTAPLIGHGMRWCGTPRRVPPVAGVIIGTIPAADASDADTAGSPGILASRQAGRVLDGARTQGHQHRDVTVLYQVLNELAAAPAGRPKVGFDTR